MHKILLLVFIVIYPCSIYSLEIKEPSLSNPASASNKVDSSSSNPKDTSYQPIDIKSNQMEGLNKTNQMIFIGNVIAKQGDITIYSDKLVAHYDNEKRYILKIEAFGNVKINQQDKVAHGENALFKNFERIIELWGSPKVWQGANIVEGEKIIIFLNEDRIVVDKANATVEPRSMEKKGE